MPTFSDENNKGELNKISCKRETMKTGLFKTWFPLDPNAIIRSYDQNRFWLTANVLKYVSYKNGALGFLQKSQMIGFTEGTRTLL